MKFVNRILEQQQLKKVFSNKISALIIVYGRRRSGKSRLIREVLQPTDIYFMADQSEAVQQRNLFAKHLAKYIVGFDKVIYPDWESLLENLNLRLKEKISVCIDEFPYLVKNAPELPSVIQKIMEEKNKLNYHLILCGSSQQMMEGLVMDATAPLYGRADEILKIKPINVAYLQEVLQTSAIKTIEEYSVWGGIPRYWELRLAENNLNDALKRYLFNSQGVLYDEPLRLFLDDMRDTVQSFTILSLIASGCHRLSEIAARLEKPATHLSGPLDKLLRLGYIEREMPYGESTKNSKKSLYKIADPLLDFYFTFVVPNRSFIEINQSEVVAQIIQPQFNQYVAAHWERLCRQAVPFIEINSQRFKPASRWWGTPAPNTEIELDVVAESIDGCTLLVGECKWSDKKVDIHKLTEQLIEKAKLLPLSKGKKVLPVLFLKHAVGTNNVIVFTAQEVIDSFLLIHKSS
ncbi:MAG: ATP-binding protein [Crocinitomicaceae bacterium]|nr:ATP-binding protein [Crocinitomicaceae bacterium]